MIRYPLRQMLTALVFVLTAVTCAIWLTQALRFIDYIVNRGVPLSTFLYLAVLLLPDFFSLVLPVATFSAVAFTYNKMTMDSELVVMRATGLSPGTLMLPALILAFGATLVGYSLSLYIAPLSHGAFKDLTYQIRNEYTNAILREGVFTTVSESLTIYVRQRSESGELIGLLVYDSRDQKSPVTFIAERGALVRTADGPRVRLVNGSRQEHPQGGTARVLTFDSYTVDLSRLQQGSSVLRWREPRERFLGELLYPEVSPETDPTAYNKLIAEGHQRLVTPLFCFSYALIAMAALLTGELNRRGQLDRILWAVLFVIASQALNLGATNLAARALSTVPLMYASVLVPSLASLYLLLAPPRRRRAPAPPAPPAPAE
jgi:lipopolysaccharide export system permease protein